MSDLPQPGTTAELLCLHRGRASLRAQIPPHGPIIVVRTRIGDDSPIEGELFAVEVTSSWTYKRTAYVSGDVTSTWLDLARLELAPLRLFPLGPRDPGQGSWGEDLPREITTELLRMGSREVYEMEQVLPETTTERRYDDDPIVEAADLAAAGDVGEAEALLADLLAVDLRCLDAHAHLGNLEFESDWPGALDRAIRHYRIGVAIGDAALGEGFAGLLPWGLVDNRPFLRCLHGLGLSCWRAGDHDTALGIFRRLLLLNPTDNQGVRTLWPEVVARLPWRDDD